MRSMFKDPQGMSLAGNAAATSSAAETSAATTYMRIAGHFD